MNAPKAVPRNVLVVDDDETVREAVAALLSQADYKVAQARNGMEALTLLGRQWFPVVVTDRSMPVLDGIEFVQRLRAIAVAPAYVIMLTTLVDSQDYERGYCAGVDHYVPKKGFEAQLTAKVGAGFNAIKRRQMTATGSGSGPIVIDLSSGAHTARHLVGRLGAEMAHATAQTHQLTVVSVAVELPATSPTSSQTIHDALLQAILGALRSGLDWVARLPAEQNTARFSIIMPQASEIEAGAFEQGVRNIFSSAPRSSALATARVTFGATELPKDNPGMTALNFLAEAERRRGAARSTANELSTVQG
ncbi:response regulator [Steroidobacter sp.]|uniref:response regulator n=1 Tax=Steroidobacter sp. TaxID=1978227 RepID=UPI001A4337B4|nr:response regulator [Steroidobacter sp.]MBL8270849.1 response regulator [Steroidobacter sp.]